MTKTQKNIANLLRRAGRKVAVIDAENELKPRLWPAWDDEKGYPNIKESKPTREKENG